MTAGSIIAVLVIFACNIAYHYIRDLRRERDAAKHDAATAWYYYGRQANEMRVLQGLPPYKETPLHPDEKKKQQIGWRPTGIGPTMINAREEQRLREELTTVDPPFADKSVLGVHSTPSSEDIAAAAREAYSNGNRSN